MWCVNFAVFVVLTKCCSANIIAAQNDATNEIKTSVNAVIGLLQNWNNLYANQIEPKILSISVGMSHLDTNIKNLQERAHVWDTFQLHISAWNEQLATTDRKIDIMLDRQEKLQSDLENKMFIFANVDYKLESIIKRMDKLEDQLGTKNAAAESDSINNKHLLSEFTTRGIISTLDSVEEKLKSIEENSLKKEVAIKCNVPPKVHDLLHDISSKVDVIFDTITENEDNLRDKAGNDQDYVDDQQEPKSCDEDEQSRFDADVKLLSTFISRINRPCKATNKLLNDISSKLTSFETKVASLNKCTHINATDQLINSNKPENSCKSEEIELSLSNWVNVITNQMHENHKALKGDIANYFHDFESSLRNSWNNNKCTENFPSSTTINPITVASFTAKPVTFSKDDSCERLSFSDESGIYRFGNGTARYCEIRDDGKWTVIQVRGMQRIPQNFSLNWENYKHGFGDLSGDFWSGNDFIHKLTHENNVTLRIELESFEGLTSWAEYRTFVVESEENKYKLIIGNYSGNASDSFSSHNNSLFSTYDKDNDDAPECCPCSVSYGGGWWFNSCFEVNLNGFYYTYPVRDNYRGIIWEHWLGSASLKKTRMMVKSRENNVDIEAENVDTVDVISTDIPFYEDP